MVKHSTLTYKLSASAASGYHKEFVLQNGHHWDVSYVYFVFKERIARFVTQNHIGSLASNVDLITIPQNLGWRETEGESFAANRILIFLKFAQTRHRRVCFQKEELVGLGKDTYLVCLG